MKCKEFDTALHDFFIGELPPERKGAVLAHAEGCPRCGSLLKTAREISCQDFVSFLNDYLDGEVSQERREVFERHLAICPECTAYLDSYRRTIELGKGSAGDDDTEAVEEMPGDLVTAIIESMKKG